LAGHDKEAKEIVAQLGISRLQRPELARHPLVRRSDLQRAVSTIVEDLRKAGVPEGEKKTD
jgi:hypothetical protein